MSLISKIRNRGNTDIPIPNHIGDSEDSKEDVLIEVIRRWEEVASLKPEDVESRIQLIQLYSEVGRSKDLDLLIEEVDEKFSSVRQARFHVARHYTKSGRTEIAIERWSSIDKDYEDQWESTNSLAHLFVRNSQYENALEMANVLITRHSHHDKAFRVHARIHELKGETKQAVAAWQQVLELSPNDRQAQIKLAIAYSRNDNDEAALELLKTISSGSPANETSLKMHIYRTLNKLNRTDEAYDVLESMIAIDPSNIDLRFDQATLWFKQNKFDQCESTCKSLLERAPSDTRILTLYARVAQSRVSTQSLANAS